MPEIRKSALFNISEILAKAKIEPRQKVAELGCGNFGFFVFPLARLVGRDGKVFAVDILKSTLEEISRSAQQENMPQVTTIWSNLEIFRAAKIENDSIDAAFLINVLHQSEKKVDIMREAIRIIKRRGRLIIIEWKNADLPLGPSPDKRVNLESLKSAAPKLGLNIEEEFEAGPFHYGILLTKM